MYVHCKYTFYAHGIHSPICKYTIFSSGETSGPANIKLTMELVRPGKLTMSSSSHANGCPGAYRRAPLCTAAATASMSGRPIRTPLLVSTSWRSDPGSAPSSALRKMRLYVVAFFLSMNLLFPIALTNSSTEVVTRDNLKNLLPENELIETLFLLSSREVL
jgi:hypothetical protein